MINCESDTNKLCRGGALIIALCAKRVESEKKDADNVQCSVGEYYTCDKPL